jgi:riboflavin biosynthesis pyrimidine reductase
VRQIHPVTGPDFEVVARAAAGPLPDAVTSVAHLYGNGAAANAAASPGRGHLRANMVASADGAGTLNGRSGGLSGPADKMIFTVLRSLADLVFVGAGTARAEHYRPVQRDEIWLQLRPESSPLPPVAVITGTLDFTGCEQLLTVPPGPSQTIVITTAAAPADRKAALAPYTRLIEAGDKRVDMRTAVDALRGLGYRSILTEGGPPLIGELIAAGLIDELCLTMSPMLAAGSAGRIVSGPPARQRLSLAHVLLDDDFLLCRYLVQETPAGT